MKLNELVPWNWGKKSDEKQVPDLLDALWHDPFGTSLMSLNRQWDTPRVEVNESKKDVTVRVEAPGVDEKDLSVDYYNGSLRIRGEKRDEKREKRKRYHYSECSYGSFVRTVPVPSGVKWDGAQAKYKKGVLTITLPKEKENSNRIAINVK
jgi:HSP20 family protein